MTQHNPLKNLNKASAAKLFAIPAFILSLIVAPSPSFSADIHTKQAIVYELYAGGINAVQANMDLSYQPGVKYGVILEAKTQGFLGKLVPWRGSFETYGWAKAKGDKPEQHQSISVWRNEEEIKTYSYGKDGKFKSLTITEGSIDKSPKDLPQDLVDQSTDAMTAALQAMKEVAAGQKCEGSSEVFDGKRRFTMKFTHVEDVDLKRTRYNIYEGPASKCIVEVIPLTGAWHKKPRGWLSIQEQGRDKGTMPTLWLAKVAEGAPAIPVKMQIKTDYGTLFMHMTKHEYTSEPKDIAAAGEEHARQSQ